MKLINKNNISYSCQLVSDLKFSDGQNITKDDIIYSINSFINKSYYSKYFNNIKEFNFKKDTINFRLKKPDIFFTSEALKYLKIIKKIDTQIIGTGPLKLINHAEKIHLEPNIYFKTNNPNYKNKKIKYKKIFLHQTLDHNTRHLKFLNREFDFLHNSLPERTYYNLSQAKEFNFFRQKGSTLHYILFNYRQNIFTKELREKLTTSIKKNEIVKSKKYGFARVAHGILPPENIFYFNNKISINFNNQETIKKTSNSVIDLEILTSTNKDYNSILKVIQSQWKAQKIKSHLKILEWGTFFQKINSGNFQIYNLQWSNISSPNIIYRVFHSNFCPPGLNRGCYKNPRLDKLLDSARFAATKKQSINFYKQSQELISKEKVFIPLWFNDNLLITQKNLVIDPKISLNSWYPLIFSSKK